MKKTIVLLAVVIFAVIGLNAQDMTMLKVKVPEADIRANPDMTSPVIKKVELGTVLKARQKTGDWYEIMLADETGVEKAGFISADAVDIEIGGEAKPAAPVDLAPVAPADQAPVAEVQDRRPSAMVFARFGSFSPGDEIFKEVYSSGFIAGGEFRIRIIDKFYVSLEGGYFKKTGALTVTEEKTTMTIYPIDVMAVYHVPLSGIFSPYLGVGAAVCKYIEENLLGKVDDWGLGLGLCGGVTAHWRSLGIDARIKYSSVKIKPLEDEANLGGFTFSLGAGVVF